MNLNLPIALESFRANIEASMQQCITITAKDGSTKISDSKFGGQPFLPIGIEYPKDYSGNPMILLTQINFAQLPKNDILPSEGVLEFYVADDDFFGMSYENPAKQIGFKILYFPDSNQEHQTDFTFLDNLMRECPPFKTNEIVESKLFFEINLDYVPLHSIEFNQFFSLEEANLFQNPNDTAKIISGVYYNAIDSKECGHKLGGYARFIQEDPRKRFTEYANYISLLQIDSQNHFMWGDAGRAHFLIDKNDLKNKNFSKVMYKWSNF
jgi:uncharacterized protein YwqG